MSTHFPSSVQLGSVYLVFLSDVDGLHHSPTKSIGICISAARARLQTTTIVTAKNSRNSLRLVIRSLQSTCASLTTGLTVLLPTDVQEPTALRFAFERSSG